MYAFYEIYASLVVLSQLLSFGSADYDPNAVAHTTKSELTSMIDEGNHELLVFFCKCLSFYYEKISKCID